MTVVEKKQVYFDEYLLTEEILVIEQKRQVKKAGINKQNKRP